MISAGRKRERIEVQQKTATVSESGETVYTWSFYCYRWAEVRTPTGKEIYAHSKMNAQLSHVVTTHWIEGLKMDMRILWGMRILNIGQLAEDRKHNEEMVVGCSEEV